MREADGHHKVVVVIRVIDIPYSDVGWACKLLMMYYNLYQTRDLPESSANWHSISYSLNCAINQNDIFSMPKPKYLTYNLL